MKNKVYLNYDINGNLLSVNGESAKNYSGSVATIEYIIQFNESLASDDMVFIAFLKCENNLK